MKPPISYYGGKQRLASRIIPLIPKHTVYCEPFCGGAAVMFNRPWPAVTSTQHYREIINDVDGSLINFYRQLRDNGPALIEKIQLTLHSEEEHRISKCFTDCDDIERARRYYVNISQSFSNELKGGWTRSVFSRNHGATWLNRITRLPEYLERMSALQVSNVDALKCIKQFDSPQTFFYCDPPYPGANQGHYSGYTERNFADLVNTLDSIDGSFMLSCYHVEGVNIPDTWERFSFEASSSATLSRGATRRKKAPSQNRKRTEVLYRKISTVPVRPEIQKLYDAGKFDCFTGKKEKLTRAELKEMF